MKVLQYKLSHVYPIFLYHNQFCKDIVVLLYDDDTVDVGYNKQVVEVDNITYHIVHNNHWLNLKLNGIANYFLFPYQLSDVFAKIKTFCQSVKKF